MGELKALTTKHTMHACINSTMYTNAIPVTEKI